MYRLGFGLQPVSQCSVRADSQSESSSDDGSDDYGGSRKRKSDDNDSDFEATESESEATADDSSDSTYEEPRSKRSRPPVRRNVVQPPRKRKRGTSSSEEENSWSGSEWSDVYRPNTTRLSAKPIKYNENSSESSAEEENAEEVTAEEEEEREEVEEEGHAEVETIEKILRQRIGRKGATGDETISYNVAEKGDPNAGVDPETEETERQFLIKWKGWSHIHNTWESEESLRLAGANGMMKLKNFRQRQDDLKMRMDLANEEDCEYLMCEREKEELIEDRHAIAERIVQRQMDSGCVEYLVKWEGLQYSQTTVEDGKLIERLFPEVVEEYRDRLMNMRTPDPKATALRKRPKFVQLREQPTRLGERNGLSLRDYQLEGLNWLLGAWCRWNGVILADEMGLGKTIQTISFIEVLMASHRIYGPFLILVPLSTIANWHEEFHLWAPHINVIEYVGDKESRTKIRDYEWRRTTEKKNGLNFNVLLTTFEILLKDEAELRVISWSALVVDEAHRLKNDESGLYKRLIPFRTNHRLLITGTPLQNSLKELWALLHFIMPDRYRFWEDFERRFSLSDKSGFESLHAELTPFILRRIKRDVEKSLPAKTERILRVEMSKLQKHFYRLILTRNVAELQKGVSGRVSSFINIVMELKKCCNHLFLISHDTSYALETLIKGSGKLILLDKLLTRLKETGHRVLIFSQMVRMLDLLDSYLRFRRFAFQRLDGSIHGDKRKQALDHFNAEGSQDFCFLLSTRAGGLGLNLATADTVIIFDSDWNPQNDLQAQARAHRIGQKNQVSVYRLVTKNSVEENILESAKKKMVLDHLVIQSMDTTGKTVLEKDFQSTKNPFSKEELNAILKFGAEELFKNNDEEEADLQMDIDDILQRAETRSAEEMANGGSSDLLAGFKVVSFDNLEDEETEEKDKGEKSWNEIIPEDIRRRLEEEERSERIVSMHLPPRNRKNFQTINYDESNGRKKTRRKYVSNDVSSESQDVTVGNAKKRGRPRHTYEEVKGLTTKELKALVKSLKKFGRPLERVHAIARDCHLAERNIDDLVKVIETILSKCTEAMEMAKSDQPKAEDGGVSGPKNATFKLAKVIITPKSILDAVEYLEPLCLWYLDEHNEIPSGIHLKATDFDCPWTPEDDVSLLKGIFKYGLGSWQTIKAKTKYRLSKILPENGEKPQGRHLSSRVEYLLNKLRKHYKDTDDSKNKKKKPKNSEDAKPTKVLKQKTNGDIIIHIKSKPLSNQKTKSNKPKTEKDVMDPLPPPQDDPPHTGDAQSCLKCKSDMYPVRKSLKLLQRDDLFDQCLLAAGDQIRLLLSQHQDRSKDTKADERKRHLWQFVGCFCGLAAEELHRFYKKLSKNRNSTKGSRSQKPSAPTTADRGSSL